MEWSALAELVFAAKVPLVAAVVGGLIGSGCTLLGTHYFTQRREREKLLRDKGEALLFLLIAARQQVNHWHGVLYNDQDQLGPTRLEAPHAIMADFYQAAILQKLYFPSVDLNALVDALAPYIPWLVTASRLCIRTPETRHAQAQVDEGLALAHAYREATQAALEAIATAIPRSGNLAAVLGRPFRHVARWYDDL